MFRNLSVRSRLVLCFSLQTVLSLAGLFYEHRITEAQMNALGKLNRDFLEHSVNVQGALFRIQSLPAEQILALLQGSIVMYSDPEALPSAFIRLKAIRDEFTDATEALKFAIHSTKVTNALEATLDYSQRFNEALDKAARLLEKGEKQEATDVLMNRCSQLQASFVASVANLQSACAGEQAEKMEETQILDSKRVLVERRSLFWIVTGIVGAGLGFVFLIRHAVWARG
jgi:hypothetical protein